MAEANGIPPVTAPENHVRYIAQVRIKPVGYWAAQGVQEALWMGLDIPPPVVLAIHQSPLPIEVLDWYCE